ncbi:red pigment-concentrating prohormone [Calliopsis andreniformis]|uniref:red pigment-concentrating prohormone n=1 Tax=Calliopsis andreniformis TaxID=337506 RepID=UPI003FCCFAA6
MYRKIRLSFLALIFLVCLSLDSGAQGQLNFSTGWGKRSHKVGTVESGSFECGPQARPTLEQVLSVYNLIQTEAQRMLDCRKLNE